MKTVITKTQRLSLSLLRRQISLVDVGENYFRFCGKAKYELHVRKADEVPVKRHLPYILRDV